MSHSAMSHRPGAPGAFRPVRGGLLLAALVAISASCSDSGGGGVTADYTLTVTPASLSIEAGSGSAAIITINRSDFTGEVTLTLSGVPAGFTAIVDPVTTTGDSATLTVSTGGTTAPGDYNMVVRSSASIGNRARAVALTVTEPPPSFEVTVDPGSITIAQGTSGNTGANITRHNFTGAVTFSLLNAPAGVTGTFDPNPTPANGSTLTLLVGPSTTPGVYDLTVVGTGSVGDDSAVLTLTVP